VLGIVADIVWVWATACDFSISANIAFASDKVRVGSATAETPNALLLDYQYPTHLSMIVDTLLVQLYQRILYSRWLTFSCITLYSFVAWCGNFASNASILFDLFD
jgi:hypothetical protein